jgi:hypothetical protein
MFIIKYREAMTPFLSARSAERKVRVGLCVSVANKNTYFLKRSELCRIS